MIGSEPIPVEEAACQHCSNKEKKPRDRNTVTAGLALRHAKEHKPEKFDKHKEELYRYVQGCDDCNGETKAIHLICALSPGDMLTLTAAVESLVKHYPGRYHISISGTAGKEIWEHNPHIAASPCKGVIQTIDMKYPSVHESNSRHVPFINGYCEYLGTTLGIPIPLSTNRPHLYLSEEEKGWINQVQQETGANIPFALVDAGVKPDYTTKQWPVEYYQKVVDETRHQIQWVQVGATEHDHSLLDNVLDFRGKTDLRQLIRLVYHCQFAVGPVTFLQHICAAWEKPYVCLLGGREPVTWVSYPLQQTLHTMGQLDCCKKKACWKSLVIKGDRPCDSPVLTGIRPVGKCMAMILPEEVIRLVNKLCVKSA